MDIRELMRLEEAAVKVNRSTGTLKLYIAAGKFPAGIEIMPRRYLYPRAAVDAWAAEFKRTGKPPAVNTDTRDD